jgi:tetratricopeptide (TPR) repeat protein
MEGHFGENELVGKKARFMALTYNRLGDLFSKQFIQKSAIYCFKQSLFFDRIAHSSPNSIANTIYHLGKEYGKLNVADSAAFYYDMALEIMPDRNSILYRDVIVSMALLNSYHDVENSLDSLKRMAALSENEMERLNRFLTVGAVYQSIGQYDSAKVWQI